MIKKIKMLNKKSALFYLCAFLIVGWIWIQ